MRCQHHARTEESHEAAALDTEVLGHHHDEGVALLRADHRKRDPGVATGCLDDGLAGLQESARLCILDDGQCNAVLDRTHRVARELLAFFGRLRTRCA